MLLMLLALFFQDAHQNTDHDDTSKPEIQFTPIGEGNVFEIEGFHLTVPKDIFLAAEENAQIMFPLVRAENIPNCRGIFFSNQGTWDWGIVVQQIGPGNYFLSPELTKEAWQEHIYGYHIGSGVAGIQGTIIEGPTTDHEAGTFTIAAAYPREDGSLEYIKKKVWVNGPYLLLMSLTSSEASYQVYEEAINAVFHSVQPVENPGEVPADMTKTSYVNFFGFNAVADEPEQATAAEEEEIQLADFWPYFVLGGAGIIVLIIAGVLNRRSQQS